MKLRVIIALAFLWNLLGNAGVDLSLSVVKVKSHFCTEGGIDSRGSGILFQYQGQAYAVTSSHVLLQGNDYCHEVSNAVIGTEKAEFLAADWAYGLGLLKLKLESSVINQLPTLDLFKYSDNEEPTPITSIGYFYESDIPHVNAFGNIIDFKSTQHWIPMVTETFELINTHGQNGMSGGIVLSNTKERIIGLLSHQYVKWISHTENVIQEYDLTHPMESTHVFVIPSEVIAHWVKHVLDDAANYSPTVLLDSPVEELGVEKVLLDGLAFQLKNDEIKPEVKPLKIELVYGGDGGGIGGLTKASLKGRTVLVSLDKTRKSKNIKFEKRPRFFEDLTKKMIERKLEFIEIRFFLNNQASILNFESLSQFFRYLLNSDYEPVALVNSLKSPQEMTAFNAKVNELAAGTKNILDRIEKERNEGKDKGKSPINELDYKNVRDLLDKIQNTIDLLKSDQACLLTIRKLEKLKNHSAWTWFSTDPCANQEGYYRDSIELRTLIIELRESGGILE